MCEEARPELKRKLEHIKREYESITSLAVACGDRISRVRTWNVTVLLAYFGYMLTFANQSPEASEVWSFGVITLELAEPVAMQPANVRVWPIAGAILLFWIMEAFATASGSFLRYGYFAKADRMFAVTDEAEFRKAVERYEFWRAKERHEEKEWPGEHARIHRFVKGLANEQTLVFYAFPLAVVLWLWLSAWPWKLVAVLPLALTVALWLNPFLWKRLPGLFRVVACVASKQKERSSGEKPEMEHTGP